MPPPRAANDEPIPGYRLVEPLGKGGFGEVWKCSAPGGLFKAVKFVAGNQELDNAGSNAAQELRAFELIRAIRHPFLLSIERVEIVNGDLVIVMELADKSLHDLLTDYKDRGQPGVPRREAVAYLHEAAEVLDLLNQEHGLKHLDVKPRNLFLVGRHLKVADFGLVGSLADLFPGSGSGRAFAGGLTPLYAAPETFQGQVTLFSDQYSLAVTYHELVTGEPVFKARNYNQLAMMACGQEPDLSRLPEEDRPVLARALAKKPRERFPSCVALLNALEDAVFAPVSVQAETPSRDPGLTDLGITPGPSRGSGFFRRRSRILPTIKAPAPDADPLAGYQLLESLGRGSTGELWRAKGPGGGSFLVRFLSTPDTDPALERLRSLRHPVLAGTRIFPAGPGRTAYVSEAGTSTLWDRFREAHASGQPGVPREELLGHLTRVADALDELYHVHQTQHLGLTPRHVGLSGGDAFLVEFGLAEWLWMPQGQGLGQLSPRYSAPELFDGLVSDACDQYGLALMFQELLVGVHPFRNLNARQLASPKLRGQPDVSLLPGPDRAVILKALSPDPEDRFRSCAELIQALEHAALGGSVAPSMIVSAPAAADDWKQAVADLTSAAGRGHTIRTDAALPYRLHAGNNIECRAWARLAPGMAKLKLAGFRDQWRAEKSEGGEGRAVFHIEGQASLWDRCMGRSPALQVEVCFGASDAQSGLSPVRIHMMPVECPRDKADGLLADLAPRVLTSLVTYLGLIGHRNGQERFPLTQLVQVASSAREWQGSLRDVGVEGLCVRLPEAVPACPVTITLQRWASPLMVRVPGRVVAVYPAEGGYEAEITLT